MTAMYDDSNIVEKTFDADFLSEELRQAQWTEFVELKKIITELSQKKRGPITILDIGIGNARILKHLSGIKEIWDLIKQYDGIDNSEKCIQISKKVISDLKLNNKTSIKFLDAINLDELKIKYDLIIFIWFTAGNFYPDDFPFKNYPEDGRIDLKKNEKFERIFRLTYEHLNSGGEIVIGSCYIDNESTMKKQEDFYKKCGMTIITDEKDSFTATKERFWSQRFTEQKIKTYLEFIPLEKITFLSLDTYKYAMLIRIKN